LSGKKPNPFPGGLLVLSPQGAIIEAPWFFIDALGLGERDVESIYELFDDESVPFLSFERVLRRQNGIFEFYIAVHDGTDIPRGFRYWSVSPNQPNRRNTPITFYIVDESSLLQSQEWRLRRLRRDMLNHVRVSLTQYMRNRLTSIQALTELLRDNPKIAAETSLRLLENIDALLDSLDDLVDTNVVYDGVDAPRIKLKDSAEIISTWGDAEHRVQARVHVLETDPLIPTEYLERIIMPLVQNSLEATLDDEIVEVDIWELDNGFCRIDIADQGDGMNEFTLERAEDPFFTTKPGHLGLGLPQAYEALQSVGGQWRIDSQPRGGTRVTLLLPVEDPAELEWLSQQFPHTQPPGGE
jgi:signal transduction histidine kinase